MLNNKVAITTLPTGGADEAERRLFSSKGELAQIINGTMNIQHLVYWDLDSPRSGQTRGNHYHKVKIDRCYVLTGELEVTVMDRQTLEREILTVKDGDCITIAPGVVHSFRSKGYAQALELLPTPYDAADTVACPI
jgi:mannose-6-phosphate isomerase-like protein (cupin superfamily)